MDSRHIPAVEDNTNCTLYRAKMNSESGDKANLYRQKYVDELLKAGYSAIEKCNSTTTSENSKSRRASLLSAANVTNK